MKKEWNFMNIDKIVNDAVQEKERDYEADEILYNKMWDKIEKKLNKNLMWYEKVSLRFQNQRISARFMEGVAVAAFIGILVVIPTYASKHGFNRKTNSESTPSAIAQNNPESMPSKTVEYKRECTKELAHALVCAVMNEIVFDSPAIKDDPENSDDNYFAVKVAGVTKEEYDVIMNAIKMGNMQTTNEGNKEPRYFRYYVEKKTLDVYKEEPGSKKKELYYKNEINNEKFTYMKNEDINGDGKKDVIKYDTLNCILSVNDVSIQTSQLYCDVYAAQVQYIQGKDSIIKIIDINKKDKIKEIVLDKDGNLDKETKDFYYYDGKKIINIGNIAN